MRKVAAALLASTLLLASCGDHSGTEVNQSQMSQFHKGSTTYDQVVAALGPPQNSTVNGDGTQQITYSYLDDRIRNSTFIPIVGAFSGGSDLNMVVTIFFFDKNGILTDMTRQQNGMSTHPDLN